MSKFRYRRLLVAAGAVVVLAGAAVGVSAVQAQTAPATPTGQTQSPRQKYLAALANRLHITVDQLQQAMAGARQDAGLPPQGESANGHGPRGLGGFFRMEADAVAVLLHEDRAALLDELPGKTLAEVAAAHNVQTADLVNTIVTTANQHIDQMAAQRNMPADRVAQIKQRIGERAQAFVTTHRFPARAAGARS